jgi:hypothetical protein
MIETLERSESEYRPYRKITSKGSPVKTISRANVSFNPWQKFGSLGSEAG